MSFLRRLLGKKKQIPSRSSNNSSSQTTGLPAPTQAAQPGGGQQQPKDQDKFEFLKELTSKATHLGKPFYGHLFGVYTYLKERKLPDEVCDAGLFHSIYGTEFYKFQSTRITRDVVRGYIGEYAEELVYIFCSLKTGRFHAIVNNTQGWSTRQHIDLCYVEFANLWDQNKNRELDGKLDILNQTIARLESSK